MGEDLSVKLLKIDHDEKIHFKNCVAVVKKKWEKREKRGYMQ